MTGACDAKKRLIRTEKLEPLSTPLGGDLPLHSLTGYGGEMCFTSSIISNIKVTNLRTKLFQSTYRSSKYPPKTREGLGISSNYIGKLGLWLVVYLPLWKFESQLGVLFPIYGKIKFMFQTTNQFSHDISFAQIFSASRSVAPDSSAPRLCCTRATELGTLTWD